MTFSHGEQLRSEVEYADNLKSSSPKALKHFAMVSAAIDAMINGNNHPDASRPMTKPVAAPVAPAAHLAPAATPRPAIAPPPYNFYVDGVIGGVVEGWIWCPQKPDNRYEVQAWCDGRLVAYGIANKFRQDLKDKGKADGNIKFELPLSRHLFDGKDHVLQIRVVGQGEPDNDRVLQAGLGFEAPNRPQRPEFLEALPSFTQSLSSSTKFACTLAETGGGGNIQKILLHLYNTEPRPARKIILELVDQGVEHPWLDARLAETFLLERNFVEAYKILKHSLSNYGVHECVLVGLCWSALKLEKLVEAKRQFNKCESKGYGDERLVRLRQWLKDSREVVTGLVDDERQQLEKRLMENPSDQSISRALLNMESPDLMTEIDLLDKNLSEELHRIRHVRVLMQVLQSMGAK